MWLIVVTIYFGNAALDDGDVYGSECFYTVWKRQKKHSVARNHFSML